MFVIAQEENLRSGLLLEQGALCLLRTRPPQLRKFSFHMTLAGLRFNACEQKALGMRAYRCAFVHKHVMCASDGGCHHWYAMMPGIMAYRDMAQT